VESNFSQRKREVGLPARSTLREVREARATRHPFFLERDGRSGPPADSDERNQCPAPRETGNLGCANRRVTDLIVLFLEPFWL